MEILNESQGGMSILTPKQLILKKTKSRDLGPYYHNRDAITGEDRERW